MKILKLMTSATFVLCATSAALSTPANAATQSLATAGYTFSYDDSFWGISGGTTFSNTGDVFTFANLGYAVSVSGSNGTGGFSDAAGSAVTVTANSGYALDKIVTQASGTFQATAGNNVAASASVLASLVTSWDVGAQYPSFSGSQGRATYLATNGNIDTGNFTVKTSVFDGPTSSAVGYIQLVGQVATAGRSSASISLDSVSFTVTSSSVSPVPEPESYAMLVAGLGLLGAVARRRKAQSNA